MDLIGTIRSDDEVDYAEGEHSGDSSDEGFIPGLTGTLPATKGKSKPDAGALKVEKTAAVAADAATTKKKKKKKSKRAKRKAAREAKTAEEEAGDDDNAGAGGDDDAEFNDSFVFGRSLAEGAGEAGWVVQDRGRASGHSATPAVDAIIKRRREEREAAGQRVDSASDSGSSSDGSASAGGASSGGESQDSQLSGSLSSSGSSSGPTSSKKRRRKRRNDGSESSEITADGSEIDSDEAERRRQERKEYFTAAPANPDSTVITDFATLSLSRPLLKGINALGYTRPTPIQARAIPLALRGSDICASAQTGSGKTAAFMLPILERLIFRPRNSAAIRVLVLLPTRELATQCHVMSQELARFTRIRIGLACGGMARGEQAAMLRTKPDVVIATPGRLIDHLHNTAGFGLEALEILVLDEADRLLELGFSDELAEIVRMSPVRRQTLLFSATMTHEVSKLISLSLRNPVLLTVDSRRNVADRLVQEFIRIRSDRESDREAIVLALCRRSFQKRVIVFFPTKAMCHRMKIILGLAGVDCDELHGDKTQAQRLAALERFRASEVDVLLATDLASRGLDITGVETIINFNMPSKLAVYIHRVGRTARAGLSGRAVTLVGEGGRKNLKAIVKRARRKPQRRVVPPDVVAKYVDAIKRLEPELDAILEEEELEKRIRISEMEASKAINILLHAEEIAARPANVWFQSNADRKATKTASAEEARMTADRLKAKRDKARKGKNKRKRGGDDSDDHGSDDEYKPKRPKRGPFDGLSRKKRRLKEWRIEMARERRESGFDAERVVAQSARQIKKRDRLRKGGTYVAPDATERDAAKRKRAKKERKQERRAARETTTAAGGGGDGAAGTKAGAKAGKGKKGKKKSFAKDLTETSGAGFKNMREKANTVRRDEAKKAHAVATGAKKKSRHSNRGGKRR